jgi:hypothetical protein
VLPETDTVEEEASQLKVLTPSPAAKSPEATADVADPTLSIPKVKESVVACCLFCPDVSSIP